MAEAFNCPSCGAPLEYDAEKQEDKGTIACPYCGESVIVPAELRHPQELRYAGIESINVQVVGQSRAPGGSSIRGCVVAGVLVVLIGAGILYFTINNFQQSVTQAIRGAVPVLELTPAPTGIPDDIRTQIAPAMAQVTQVVAEVTRQAAQTPTRPAATPTPTLNVTATAEAQATLTAESDLMVQQRNWPAVVQEKFANNQRNWNTGQDNNDLAVEDLAISGNKYTWKMTSKKSMGSFSFPDMPVQQDLYVSVDLQMTTSSGNASDQAGIIFRHSVKDQAFYFFGANPEGTYSLTFYDGSSWNDLIATTQTGLLKPGQVNHLAVSMQGSQILLMINNAIAGSYEDARAASGIAGLGINMPAPGEDSTFVFTNFYVRAPKK